ncbi:hypothetical protein [Roseisolibacter sp. H3M3-2]|uniref:ankyrin repeat domain-containing protein n=1 Tax=Roseisolibacter sp. H3M3-2 TaxID=3031323 RepID=UPI0023DA82DA|nr:hypothetical protein [Roseisolibacter sp. H3M3-2]MDF1502952.1 hypothetical protein [Roseisolibacter sp. H3M3-2]
MQALWIGNAVLLAVALGVALFATGQDAAGRGAVWFVPVALALALAASWGAARAGLRPLALGLGALGPLVATALVATGGRSMLAGRAEGSGAAYWDDPASRAVARAIADGDTAALRAAARGADLEAEGRERMTLLAFAVLRRPEMTAPLLALGARPDHTPEGRLSALALALDSAGPAFDALMAGGADPNGEGDHEAPILFGAIRAGDRARYDALLARGADVGRVDAGGRTALFAAVESRDWAVARELLARGVDPARPAADGGTVAALLARVRGPADEADPDFRAVVARIAPR